MIVIRKINIILIMFSFIVLSAWSDNLFAAESIATFSSVNGEVRVKSAYREKGKWLRVKRAGVALFNGDQVKTFAGSAELTFNDGSLMKISENSSLSIEERPTKKKLFGFIDMSYMNRNVKVSFGKLWANVKKARGMWTSFESRVAVAGIKGTTVSMFVDSRGDMQFSNMEGDVEIAKHDGSFTLKLDKGRDVWVKAEEGGKTLIQSVKGGMKIYCDDIDIQLEDKGAIILGLSGKESSVEVTDYSEGSVKVFASLAVILLDASEAVNIESDNLRNELKILTPGSSVGYIDILIANVKAALDSGEGILIKIDDDKGLATVKIINSVDGIYLIDENGKTFNLEEGNTLDVQTWGYVSDYSQEKIVPEPELVNPTPPVEPSSPTVP